MMKNRIQNLTSTALMAGILCIVGPVMIPIGIIPISLTNMVVYLVVLLLDKKKATISVALYLLIGLVGIPVFAGFSGGVGKLFGPTGGYLLGYPALSWISGILLEKFSQKDKGELNKKTEQRKEKIGKGIKIGKEMLALATGTLCLYLLGTFWLVLQSNMTFTAALSVGVVPFIVFDVIKIIAAVSVGNSIKKRISFLI